MVFSNTFRMGNKGYNETPTERPRIMKDWKFALVTLLIVGAALTVAELICTEKPVEREYTPSSDVEYTIATLRAIDRASQHIREKITLGHYADISIDKLEETINTDQEFYILMFLAQED